jgi:hypothetical protein
MKVYYNFTLDSCSKWMNVKKASIHINGLPCVEIFIHVHICIRITFCIFQVLVLRLRISVGTLPSTLPLVMATPPSPRRWSPMVPTSWSVGPGVCSPCTWLASVGTLTVWRISSQGVSEWHACIYIYNGRVYGVLVQFGCCQHRHEWLWKSSFILSGEREVCVWYRN